MAPRKSFLTIRRRLFRWSLMTLTSVGILASVHYAYAQSTGPGSYDASSYLDPQALQNLLSLDDGQLQSRLVNEWAQVREVLDRFAPPGLVVVPQSQSFSAAQNACLDSRSVPACRIFISDLIKKHQAKAQQGGALFSPFSSSR